jgi:hypothetical protein
VIKISGQTKENYLNDNFKHAPVTGEDANAKAKKGVMILFSSKAAEPEIPRLTVTAYLTFVVDTARIFSG